MTEFFIGMKKVLIVDDSEANLFLIESIFEKETEIMISVESDSENALSTLKSEIPDLLVLDLMMPHIDGFQLLESIHADAELRSVPILVISARHDLEAIERVMQYNVVDYIKKPVNLNEIENKIRDILDANTVKSH